ncbi:hypothetical protein [Actinophytocola gossypii]|uniref:Uncharacterized protein n=1 Tax=Actinophytocola gossypii TaxID=2812003 RepID=A0ABT2JBG3_9PSEU|nr:hypothetical protein [Actinophytocola gossypii]MCT2585108.1 hypothetical protein [Actinophytocola gossypii]
MPTDAHPGLDPAGPRTAGPMFAALYGSLRPHPERGSRDPYALFHDRSVAMGWIDGLWGMNDAGLGDPGSSLVAWFQVGAEAVPGDRPLPVQPFLRCAGDVVARIGRLGLRAVQVLLPVQGLEPSPRTPSMFAARWFDDRDPRSRTPVRVTLDSGRATSVPEAAGALRDRIRQLHQDVFVCESSEVGGHEPPAPPFDDGFWNGPPGQRVTFEGTLAEWSPDALGWLGAFLGDLAAQQGVTSPLLLTVSTIEGEEPL